MRLSVCSALLEHEKAERRLRNVGYNERVQAAASQRRDMDAWRKLLAKCRKHANLEPSKGGYFSCPNPAPWPELATDADRRAYDAQRKLMDEALGN